MFFCFFKMVGSGGRNAVTVNQSPLPTWLESEIKSNSVCITNF